MTVYGVAVWHKGRSSLVKQHGRMPKLFLSRRDAQFAISLGAITRPKGYVLRPVKMKLTEVTVR